MSTRPPGESKLARTNRGRGIRQLGKYEISGEIGRGSFGRVYKGFDPYVEREVAIKVAEARDDARQHDAFFVEARAAGKLSHPSIVTLYDAGFEEGLSYIVMEYIDGVTLKHYCSKDSPRPRFETVAEIAAKCSLALDYIHRLGVLHKDIKPSNIMVTADGRPKIMDFSIAAMAGAAAGTTIAGSPMYMSPEQINGQPLGPGADLYSLGTVLFQLLTGQPPFAARDHGQLFDQIRTQPPPELKTVRPDLPDPLCEIVDRLLQKDPKARYQSGRKLADDLAPLANRTGPRRRNLTMSHDSLRKLRFFSAFKTRELGELMDASQTLTCKAGESLIREGEVDNSLYVLLMGLAEVRKNGHLIALLEKGDCFGEIGFLYAVERTASVVASTDVMVLKINAELLESMSEECQLRYYKIFCENLIVRLTLTTEKAARLLPKSDIALDFLLP